MALSFVPMEHGRFITFEGGEGSGKSTQAHLLQARLEQAGINAVLTREPGGSPGAEEIRHLLVRGDAGRWNALSEVLLLYAARNDHLIRTIRPALRRGYWVISDRFSDSSHAYQGAAGGIDTAFLDILDRQVVQKTIPDLTIILDIPARAGLERALQRKDASAVETRFENKKLEFHQDLRRGFLKIAETDPQRCAVVNAIGDAEEIASKIWHIANDRLRISQ